MIADISTAIANTLSANAGNRLTDELILGMRAVLQQQLDAVTPRPTPVPRQPNEHYKGYTFAHVDFEAALPSLMPLHTAHWQETEGYRHGLQMHPNYAGMRAMEQIGQFMQFVILDSHADIVGHGAFYLQPCFHTGKLVATEDTWYIVPEHRKGLLAARFLRFMEGVATRLGAAESRVSVKTVNRVNVLLERMGYSLVAHQYSKMLGENHV